MHSNSRVRKDPAFFLAFSLYMAGGLFLTYRYIHQINPDFLSYLSVAQKYLRGDFYHAVNGCWSPLFSWLLVPFLPLGIDPLVSARVLQLAIGAAAFFGIRTLSYLFDISPPVRTVLSMVLVPVLLNFTFLTLTPDLLLLCLLVYYLNSLFKEDYPQSVRNAVACGVLGGLAYLAKAYGFVFFVIHFSLCNFLLWRKAQDAQEKRNIVRNLIVGLLIFLTISGVWIYCISWKYHRLTMSTAIGYNYRVSGAKVRGNPVDVLGFIPPSNPTAISAWEDPASLELRDPHVSGAQSRVNVIASNIIKTIRIYNDFSFLFIPILLCAFIWCFLSVRAFTQSVFLLFLVTFLVFSAGYLIITTELRYLFLGCILILLLGAQLLSSMIKNAFFQGRSTRMAMAFFSLFFLVMPLRNIEFNSANLNRTYDTAMVLKELQVRGNLASDDQWSKSMYMAYYLGGRYYGLSRGYRNVDEVLNGLLRYNIDYYFVWNNAEPGFLAGYKEVTGGKIPGMRVYSLKEAVR